MEYKKDEILTSNDILLYNIRETFLKEYAEKNGWDIKSLTNEQLKEIKSKDGYKKPNMMLS